MGKAFLLKISDGNNPPQYRTMAGFRLKQETITPEAMSFEASGIFLGSEAENILRGHAIAGTLADYELSFEDGVRMHRRLLVTRLDYTGDYNGERSYTIAMESTALPHRKETTNE